MRRRNAAISAFTVEVRCPHCGEPQPSPTGSHFWEVGEVANAATLNSKRDCTACDEPIAIVFQARIPCEVSP